VPGDLVQCLAKLWQHPGELVAEGEDEVVDEPFHDTNPCHLRTRIHACRMRRRRRIPFITATRDWLVLSHIDETRMPEAHTQGKCQREET